LSVLRRLLDTIMYFWSEGEEPGGLGRTGHVF
jgi:hypothetical protein